MDSPSPFSPDYATARRRFRDAVRQLGWACEAHTVGPAGPAGEDLTMDVAVSPAPDAARTVVVSAGLHGVEGFFGSAVQLDWLRRQTPDRSGPVRFVFLHALSPFGFAWVRRYDEKNVDLNRNFLLPGESFAGAPPGYAELDTVLNPPSPPGRWDPFVFRAGWEVFRRGLPAMKRVIMTGQYAYPRGVFFGGTGPARTQDILVSHLSRWIGPVRHVVHLDYHTGLGPWGTHKLLIDYPLHDSEKGQLARLFGTETLETCEAEGTAYPAHGDFGRWCVSRGLAETYLFVCAEFGTYGPITMLAGVRAENRAHQWGKPGSPSTRRAKERLKELFCPADPAWRARTVRDGTALIDAAAGDYSGA